jgi:hypothetical protein
MPERLGKCWGNLAATKVPHRGPLDDASIPSYDLSRRRPHR